MVVVEEKVETKVQEEIGKLEPKVRNKVKSDLQEELKEELKKEILDELKEEEKHRDVVIFKPFGWSCFSSKHERTDCPSENNLLCLQNLRIFHDRLIDFIDLGRPKIVPFLNWVGAFVRFVAYLFSIKIFG